MIDLPFAKSLTDPICAADAEVEFDCGSPELNAFFARHAFENARRGIGKTFVLRRAGGEPDLPLVVGFYTLSMASLEQTVLPRRLRENLPRYPLPVALLGRLAVDTRAKGRGFGELLIGDAFVRVLTAAESVGCFGIIVDAKDERAAAFYERFGFFFLKETAFQIAGRSRGGGDPDARSHCRFSTTLATTRTAS